MKIQHSTQKVAFHGSTIPPIHVFRSIRTISRIPHNVAFIGKD